MKAIKTRYIGPTNTRGSRIKATDEDGNNVTMSYNDALNSDDMHRCAAETLCKKINWKGDIIGGRLKDCMVWVFVE